MPVAHRLLNLLAAWSALAQLPAQQPEPVFLPDAERRAFLAEVEKAMAEVAVVAAEFAQEKHLDVFEEVVKSEGVILFERPDRLRWEIQAPFRSLLLVVGDQVAKFEGSVTEGGEPVWKKLELGRGGDVVLTVMAQIRGWFRGKFGDAGGLYDLQVARTPKPLIRLLPRDKTLQKGIARIELQLARDLASVVGLTIFEVGGDRTVMRFDRLPVPERVPKACFAADAPARVDPAAMRRSEGREGLGEKGS